MSTRRLAEFCAGVTFEQIPTEAIDQAKNAFLDFLGVATYVGTAKPWGRIVGQFAADEGGCQPEATIIGFGKRTLASKAALANGTMGLGFEFEDTYMRYGGHPGPMVLPAVIALAEKGGRSGRDVLAAMLVGYEVTCRLAWALGAEAKYRELTERGLYQPASNGCIGAAAGAARILDLDGHWFNHAIGLGVMQATALYQAHVEGVMARRLHGGKAAESAVTAALLAQRGITGPEQSLEGKAGYYRALLRIDFDPERLTVGLGEEWQIRYLWFKPFPTNGAVHSSIEAALHLREAHRIAPEEIEAIRIDFGGRNPFFASKEIHSITSAQLSAPFLVAFALIRGSVTAEDLTDDAYRDAKVLELMQRVSVVDDQALRDKAVAASTLPARYVNPARLNIRLRDGRELVKEILFPKGDYDNPMSREDFRQKFNRNTAHVFDESRQEAIFEMVMGIEGLKNIRNLMELLSPQF